MSIILWALEDTDRSIHLVAGSRTRSIIIVNFEPYSTTSNISPTRSLSTEPSFHAAKDSFNRRFLSTSVYYENETNTTFSTSMRAKSWFSSNATDSISEISSTAELSLLQNLTTQTFIKSEIAKNSQPSSFPSSRLPTPSTRLNRSKTVEHESKPYARISLPVYPCQRP